MVKTNNPISRARLSVVEAHKLVTLMLSDFTEMRLSYPEYAKHATRELGFPVLASHVKLRVVEFEIPHGEKVHADPAEFTAMLLKHEKQMAELTERVNMLETWVNATFPTRGTKKALQTG